MIDSIRFRSTMKDSFPLVVLSFVYVAFSIYLVYIKLPINWDYPIYVHNIGQMESSVLDTRAIAFSVYYSLAFFIKTWFSLDPEETYKMTLFLILMAMLLLSIAIACELRWFVAKIGISNENMSLHTLVVFLLFFPLFPIFIGLEKQLMFNLLVECEIYAFFRALNWLSRSFILPCLFLLISTTIFSTLIFFSSVLAILFMPFILCFGLLASCLPSSAIMLKKRVIFVLTYFFGNVLAMLWTHELGKELVFDSISPLESSIETAALLSPIEMTPLDILLVSLLTFCILSILAALFLNQVKIRTQYATAFVICWRFLVFFSFVLIVLLLILEGEKPMAARDNFSFVFIYIWGGWITFQTFFLNNYLDKRNFLLVPLEGIVLILNCGIFLILSMLGEKLGENFPAHRIQYLIFIPVAMIAFILWNKEEHSASAWVYYYLGPPLVIGLILLSYARSFNIIQIYLKLVEADSSIILFCTVVLIFSITLGRFLSRFNFTELPFFERKRMKSGILVLLLIGQVILTVFLGVVTPSTVDQEEYDFMKNDLPNLVPDNSNIGCPPNLAHWVVTLLSEKNVEAFTIWDNAPTSIGFYAYSVFEGTPINSSYSGFYALITKSPISSSYVQFDSEKIPTSIEYEIIYSSDSGTVFLLYFS